MRTLPETETEKTDRERAAPGGFLRRWVFVLLGLFFVGLGALGAFLPVLPTTPFLLLASACFMRSSPKLNRWLLRARLFGPFLRDWQKHHGVRLRVKVLAIALLVVAVGFSLLSESLSLPLKAALIALALIGLIVVLRLKLIREPPSPADRQPIREQVG